MQYRLIAVLFFFIIITGPAFAEDADNISIWDDGYVYELDDIRYVPSTYLPNQTITCVGYVCYWCDIVGYEHSIKIDNQFYVNGSVPDSIIVMYDVYDTVDMWDWGVESLDMSIISIETNGTITTVTASVYIKYYESKKVCVNTWQGQVCHVVKTYYEDEYIIYEYDYNTPKQYPSIESTTIEVRYYNNSIKPKALALNNLGNLNTKIEYQYYNESLIYRRYIYLINYTDKNVPYGEFATINQWDPAPDNTKILPFNDVAWMPGIFSPTELNIDVSNPYTSIPAAINVTEYGEIEPKFPIFKMIGILLPLLFIGYFITKLGAIK